MNPTEYATFLRMRLIEQILSKALWDDSKKSTYFRKVCDIVAVDGPMPFLKVYLEIFHDGSMIFPDGTTQEYIEWMRTRLLLEWVISHSVDGIAQCDLDLWQ